MNRDKAPFVFTPEFLYVMGGNKSDGYNKFVDYCTRAYNVLRKHAHLFINLFAMMLSTGIPELKTADDIGYMRDAFTLDKTDKEAADFFISLITESLNTSMTRINNYIHIMAHQSRV
uniref:PI3K/PI4K catalytic domain-containing protein n=2 Tax=Palpitomonas bilix TaxID=652834 RepID=A0A7S3G347_9EUKA|mmetsp:Transcript_15197/g.38381  ORF Transcript_15197/g.38381 Transcript_15197/m.38381 type:complete len:117 (+) Transcript_15197:91-441(+)